MLILKWQRDISQKIIQEFGDPTEVGLEPLDVYSVIPRFIRKWNGAGVDGARLTADRVIELCEANMRRFGDDPAHILKLLVYGNYEGWEIQPDLASRGLDMLFESRFVKQ